MSLAIAVRAWQFGAAPPGFNQDEALLAYDAYSLSLYGEDQHGIKMPVHLTSWKYGQMSALPAYAMAPFIKMLGLEPAAARLPFLILSLLGLWVFYLFAKTAAGQPAAAIALLFAAICPWHIMQSRWALDCNFFPHFLLFGAYFLNKGLSGAKWKMYLSMFFFAMSMYCYGVSFISVPILLVALCALALATRRATPGQAAICVAAYLAFSWPLFVMMAINYMRMPSIETPFFTIPFFPETIRAQGLLMFSENIPKQLAENAKSLFYVVALQKENLPWNSIPGFGMVYPLAMPFALIGIACAIRHSKSCAIVLIWLCVSIISGLIVNDVNSNRINAIYYPLIFLIGLGIKSVADIAEKVKIPKAASFCAAGFAFFLPFTLFCKSYFTEHKELLGAYFYEGFYQAFDFAQEKNPEVYHLTANTQSQYSTWVTEAIALYASRSDPRYVQGRKHITIDGHASLGYNEKYLCEIFLSAPVPKQGDIYIINISEKEFFPENLFDVTEFGGFAAAIPRV
jgi:hypothetical protein